MSQQLLIKNIKVGPHLISLTLQDQTPIVECEKKPFANIWLLADQIKELNQESYLCQFAEISNFFWKGLSFQFIHSIPEYQEQYRARVKLEQQHPADLFEYRLTDFKLFDVAVMHAAKVEQGQLSYYVYNTSNGLPYRVVCPFPYTNSTSTFVHYQILPVLG